MILALTIVDSQGWLLIIAAIFAGVGAPLTLILQYLAAKQRNRIESKTDGMLLVSMRREAVALRALATKTENPVDVKQAEEAEAAYLAMERQHAAVTATPKI